MRSSLTIHLLIFSSSIKGRKQNVLFPKQYWRTKKGGEPVPMTQLQQQLKPVAHWRGSEKTADAVRHEIARRWGDAEAAKYDPLTNCFTIQTWNQLGYRVKKGEKAIRSITYVEGTDQTEDDDEEEVDVRKYRKTVYLFYRTQVEKR
jgi:hypothetical protein